MRKKYFFTAILFLLFASWTSGCAIAQNEPLNIVKNGGFEQGDSSWGTNKIAKVVEGVSYSGKHSLYYKNSDPDIYKRFNQRHDVVPGQRLQFSAWVKGKNIKASNGGNGGAGIYVQGYDADKKYIGGSFPKWINGTFNWTRVSGEYLVPDGVVNVAIGLYLRPKVTGEVWFDDVQVTLGDPVEFVPTLRFPQYRGYVMKSDLSPWQTSIRVNPQLDWKTNDIRVVSSIINNDEKVLLSQDKIVSPIDRNAKISIARPERLPLGNYTLKQEFFNPNGKKTLVQEYPIHVVQKMPQVYVDQQGFTVVNGKRFFPLGAYTGSHGSGGNFKTNSGAKDMERMADIGLNTILSYGYARDPISKADAEEYMNLAAKHGLRVIYSIKDMYDGHANYPQKNMSGAQAAAEQIENVKDHPALLAWYINDEMKEDWLDRLQKRYRDVVKADPNHPAYMVSNSLSDNEKFFPMTDILGMDPYPVGDNRFPDLDTVAEWTKATTKATRNHKGMWMVSQIHNLESIRKEGREPTFDEMRNMAYQELINGAKGLLYFSYSWLFFDMDENGKRTYSQEIFDKRWPNIKKMTGEIKPLTNVILQDEKVEVKVLSSSNVQYQAWKYDGKLYIMVANAKTWDEAATLRLQIPHDLQLVNTELRGIDAQLDGQNLNLQLSPVASGTIILE